MAAVSLMKRESASAVHEIAKRSNWAGQNAGVVLVFCIVFVVAVGLIFLFGHKKWQARKAAKESQRG